MSYLLVLGGLLLLAGGGEALIRGAVALAERLGISPVFVGLTVVAIGTSTPELTVAINAAMTGTPDIAVGSVIGSNISNILLVLAATALVQPIIVDPRMVFRDGLFLLAVSFGVAMVALTGLITPGQGTAMVVLLVFYLVFSYWAEMVRNAPSAERREAEVAEYKGIPPKFIYAIPAILIGLVGVVQGAEFLVQGATEIALSMGVSEAVIGLSLVAVGTSLPELAVSLLAAYRGHAGVAVGNIIGSNISNLLLILGVTGFITETPVAAQIARYDVWVMVAATAIMVPVMVTGLRISRAEGVLFLTAYVLYLVSIFTGLPDMVMSVLYG
ncbi:calcium/sodium antiporter [Pyruvatibacter mobilis]|uniref:Calcium/sodium antiporter n=1 Tax=Pyruvatibacter mobilis TaxID=1712261 RepID=A0A845QIJ8_9HYPH|nr:calcium/sodium antiporter [Pyruvatibacter mobilis]NBG97101.1 calcium/sodium antiporter [Pyruvatibacter mobilis]QJD74381.1 calcium/sodium antiporter [Pyruvatibacter mobilis]GGD06487.1 sodium:calcium antiporter [Pyruvatibacter mobilis]